MRIAIPHLKHHDEDGRDLYVDMYIEKYGTGKLPSKYEKALERFFHTKDKKVMLRKALNSKHVVILCPHTGKVEIMDVSSGEMVKRIGGIMQDRIERIANRIAQDRDDFEQAIDILGKKFGFLSTMRGWFIRKRSSDRALMAEKGYGNRLAYGRELGLFGRGTKLSGTALTIEPEWGTDLQQQWREEELLEDIQKAARWLSSGTTIRAKVADSFVTMEKQWGVEIPDWIQDHMTKYCIKTMPKLLEKGMSGKVWRYDIAG